MERPFFSILIPAYKPNLHLFDLCIKSLLSQGFGSIEIIVCEQGGDNLNAFLSGYRNIKVIHLAEPSSYKARICLYNSAQGKYVIYADCDDIYLQGSLEWLYGQIKRTEEQDLYIYHLKRIPCETNEYTKMTYVDDFKPLSQSQCKQFLLTRKMPNSVVLKCSKRDVTKKFIEADVFMADDVLLSYAIISSSKTIFVSESELYGYRDNPNSGTKTISINHLIDELKVFNCLSNIEASKELLACNWSIVYRQILKYMSSLYLNKKISYKERRFLLKGNDFTQFIRYKTSNEKTIQEFGTKGITKKDHAQYFVLFKCPYLLSKLFTKVYFCLKK